MYEVELRARIDGVVKEKIAATCERTGEKTQEDEYFSFIDDDIPVLRIRRQGDVAILNFKGIGPAAGVWPEWETRIEEPGRLKDVLLTSKFRLLMTIRKRRTRYVQGDFEINVDEIDGLGTFVEAELMAENHERAHARIRELFSRLGIPENAIVAKSYIDMLLGK